MIMLFILDEDKLLVDQTTYKATNDVRNELNGRRPSDQVVKTTPADGSAPRPCMPRRFPTGVWRVKMPIRSTNPTYAPYKIPTSARQNIFIWETRDGEYHKVSDETVVDGFYHLHYSKNYTTTLGCIRLDSQADAIEIANAVRNAIGKGEKVWLEVVATR